MRFGNLFGSATDGLVAAHSGLTGKRSENLIMLTRAWAVVALLIASSPIYAAGDDPQPAIDVAHENALPLPLYRSLRQKLAAVSDNAATMQKMAAESQDGDDEQREAAKISALSAQASLAELQSEVQKNEEQLIAALSARQNVQREMAARVLAFAADRKAAVNALLPVLKDSDSDVRTAAAVSLGLLGDAAAAEALIGSLSDEDEHVRLRAAEALGLIKDDQAVAPLLKVLSHESEASVRMQAAVALGRIKTGVKSDDLNALLENESDERVRMALAAAIKAVSGSDLALEEIPDPGEFRKRLEALSEDMTDLHDKLRKDRHDETVQLEGKDVERKLQEMIDELQRMENVANSQRKDRPQDRTRQASSSSSRSSGGRPDASGSGGGDGVEGRVNPSEVVARQETWSQLPPKERDELLQIYRPEIPMRWRKRLEAYFVSVAQEDAAQKRKLTEQQESDPTQDKAP